MPKKLEKTYQVWVQNDCDGYSMSEYDTLEECMAQIKFTTDWYLTRKVDFEIKATELK